jgi:ABC-2 type transport system permease protein
MNWQQVKIVMLWEIRKNIRSPGFLIMTVLIPLLMLAAAALPFITQGQDPANQTKDVAVLDLTENGQLGERFSDVEANDTRFVLFQGTEDELRESVAGGEYDGGLLFRNDFFSDETVIMFLQDMGLQSRARNLVGSFVNAQMLDVKLDQLGLAEAEKEYLYSAPALEIIPAEGSEGRDEADEPSSAFPAEVADMVMPLILGVLLLVSLMVLGQVMMYGVIKEKKNRIVEVLLSSLTAQELMTGKLLSFGLLSMVQITVWVTAGLWAASRFLDVRLVLQGRVSVYLPMFAYFILGYLLISSLFAAMGAIMKDAESGSQVQGMVVLIPMMPIFLATPIIMAPNALWVRIVSFIPIFTPGMMLLRIGMVDLPAWEVAGTVGLLAIAVVWFTRIAARIFEGSILQFDTAASMRQVLRMAVRTGR